MTSSTSTLLPRPATSPAARGRQGPPPPARPCTRPGMDPTWWELDTPAFSTAVRLCLDCPLRQPCREEAERQHLSGVYGGLRFLEGRVVQWTSPLPDNSGVRALSRADLLAERYGDVSRLAQEIAPDDGVRLLKPCGTHAAFERHRAHGEQPCQDCIGAEHHYQNHRRRRR